MQAGMNTGIAMLVGTGLLWAAWGAVVSRCTRGILRTTAFAAASLFVATFPIVADERPETTEVSAQRSTSAAADLAQWATLPADGPAGMPLPVARSWMMDGMFSPERFMEMIEDGHHVMLTFRGMTQHVVQAHLAFRVQNAGGNFLVLTSAFEGEHSVDGDELKGPLAVVRQPDETDGP